jgi:hypothetical protein
LFYWDHGEFRGNRLHGERGTFPTTYILNVVPRGLW